MTDGETVTVRERWDGGRGVGAGAGVGPPLPASGMFIRRPLPGASGLFQRVSARSGCSSSASATAAAADGNGAEARVDGKNEAGNVEETVVSTLGAGVHM